MLARYPDGESPGYWLQALFDSHPAGDRGIVDQAQRVPYASFRDYYIPRGNAVLLFVKKGTMEAQNATTALLDTDNPDWWVKGAEDTADSEGFRYFWARSKHDINGTINPPASSFQNFIDAAPAATAAQLKAAANVVGEGIYSAASAVGEGAKDVYGAAVAGVKETKQAVEYGVKVTFWVALVVAVFVVAGPAIAKSTAKIVKG